MEVSQLQCQEHHLFRNNDEKRFSKGKPINKQVGFVMTNARNLLKAPIASVEVSMPYICGTVKVLCLKDPLHISSSSSSSFEGYPLQVRHKQDWGQGFILLLP